MTHYSSLTLLSLSPWWRASIFPLRPFYERLLRSVPCMHPYLCYAQKCLDVIPGGGKLGNMTLGNWAVWWILYHPRVLYAPFVWIFIRKGGSSGGGGGVVSGYCWSRVSWFRILINRMDYVHFIFYTTFIWYIFDTIYIYIYIYKIGLFSHCRQFEFAILSSYDDDGERNCRTLFVPLKNDRIF